MKRAILIISLLLAVIAAVASEPKLAFKTFAQGSQRFAQVKAWADSGAEIYYYNEGYILAGFEGAKEPGFQAVPALRAGEKLYLIDDGPEIDLSRLEAEGRILQKLPGDLLYASHLDELGMRTITGASFTRMDFSPIRLIQDGFKAKALLETRQGISTLVSMVSADTVLAYIQALQDMGTRYALADNRLQVAQWIQGKFQSFGMDADLQEFEYRGQQYNVVAQIPGSIYPDQYIVVGGHHDSITYDEPMSFAPGADDNASGAIAALEIARVLKAANFEPKCTIRFVTYAAEEFGLHGSHHNAGASLSETEDIRLMINHDMIAHNTPVSNLVRLMPYDGAMEHSAHAQLLTDHYSDLTAVYGAANSHSSDSYSYWSRGYPVVYFFENYFSPHYHSNLDIVANLDADYCAEVIKASLAATVSFANMPKAVENLTVQDPGAGNSLRISWEMPDDPEADRVRIYCSTDDPHQSEPIELSGQNHYLATGLTEGTVYNFAVTVLDDAGNESYSAYASGSTHTVPRAPQNLLAEPVRDGIHLSWESNTELDLAGYRLWRSDDPGGEFQLLHYAGPGENDYPDTDLFGAIEQLYFYRIQAVDTDGNISEHSCLAGGRPGSLDNGILLIDATSGGSGANPLSPTDEEVNDYYSAVLSNFEYHSMDLNLMTRNLRLYDICIFSTIIWHDVDSITEVLDAEVTEALEDYIAMGGNLLYNGYFPTKALGGNAGYPATFDEESYMNRVLGVGGAAYHLRARMNMALSVEEGWPDLQVGEHAGMPAFDYHIIKVESLGAADHGQIWYRYGSGYPEGSQYAIMQGEPVGIYSQYQEGRSLLLSFPLYAMDQQNSKAMLRNLLNLKWGEPLAGENPDPPGPGPLSIMQNYPNPFRESTIIKVRGVDADLPLSLKIYNVRGQLLRELHQEEAKAAYIWDGLDDGGRLVGSGLYIIRASQNGKSSSRKVIRMK